MIAHLIGWLMLAAPFVALFAWVAWMEGWRVSLMLFAAIVASGVWMTTAVLLVSH
jgi:hypothetical protein